MQLIRNLSIFILQKRVLLFTLIIFSGPISSGNAADFLIENADRYNLERLPIPDPDGYLLKRSIIKLNGKIETDDQKKLQTLVNSIDKSNLQWANPILSLNSKGGSFSEAIEIAKFVRKRGIPTLIEKGAKCLSACSVIFMSGYEYSPSRESPSTRSRYVEYPSKLGFHRPYIDLSRENIPENTLRNLNYQEIGNLIIEKINNIYEAVNIQIQRMLEVDPSAWNTSLLMKMLLKPQDEFLWLETVGNALDWEIKIINVSPRAQSFDDPRIYYWLCFNSVPIEEALNLGWNFSNEEQTLEKEEQILEQSHYFITKLEHKNMTHEWEKYYVMQEHLNGSGCELQVSTDKKYIKIDREFFSFDFPSDHLNTYSRKTKLSSVIKKR